MEILQETKAWKADMQAVHVVARRFGEYLDLLQEELIEDGLDSQTWSKRYKAGFERYKIIQDEAAKLLNRMPSGELIGDKTFLSYPFFPSYRIVNVFLPRLVRATRIFDLSLWLEFRAETDEHRTLAAEARRTAKEYATVALLQLHDAPNYTWDTVSGPWLGESMRDLTHRFGELSAVGQRLEQAIASYR